MQKVSHSYRRRMKAHAPPPPPAPQPAPRHIFRTTTPDGGGTSSMEAKENILRATVDLQLTLPQGNQIYVTEDGSKALMDLLVELCSRYHLNPALHTLEVLSPEGQSLGFKPNALLGSLNVACVLIKEKVSEEKVARRPAPKVPEKTVRLMVNYHGNQKAVVRVNPLISLQALIPVICDKCEFDPTRVLLLKDSISQRELPLDKTLAELGIKDLYVHDQRLAFQPKMASAPALNYTDFVRSSTGSLDRPEKKGLLGIFQFSRRKSKTETTSVDMDDFDDKIIQNTDTQSCDVSTVSGFSSGPNWSGTLGQSQSVASIPRLSPKAETKKRRAPPPPPAPAPRLEHTTVESYQMSLGSESQQRKRKAPAPPPTPTSITQGSDDTSASVARTPDSQAPDKPTPASRTKVAHSTTASAATVIKLTEKAASHKIAVDPVSNAMPTSSSPTPSSSTTDSLAVQDSSSELSQGLDDSDADLEQAESHYSYSSSSTTSGSVRVQPAAKNSSGRVEDSVSSAAGKITQDRMSENNSMSETESALNLKLEEAENNRHSGMGNSDRPAPPKPLRSPVQEPSQHVSPSTPPSTPPPTEPTESNSPQNLTEVKEAPQSWLHSVQNSAVSDQKPETEAPLAETLSLGSSSASSSLPDQGYAASEGMAEGEDSGMISSPSDTQPTSPDGSVSLDGSSGWKPAGPVRDSSSESDEGCATWGSVHRHKDISPQSQSVILENSFEDDPKLAAELHQTLADFEADLADHEDVISAKEAPYTISSDSNVVPVSVVDMDVPVTAIDEVLEDYDHNIIEHEVKAFTRKESAGSKEHGFCHKSRMEPENKNNNAYTEAVNNKRNRTNTKDLSQSEQHTKPAENKSVCDRKEKKIKEKKTKEMNLVNSNSVKGDKQISAVKSNDDVHENVRSAEILPDPVRCNAESFEKKKPDLPPASQKPVSTEKDEQTHRVFPTSHNKITRNVTSRFGMKTFTVIPPKPSVINTAKEQSGVPFTIGAIKIDDQGNMVKAGISRNNVSRSSESQINSDEGSPLLGKAKAFWSSNERQDTAVKLSKDKAEESKSKLKSASTSVKETTLKTSNTEYLKSTQSTVSKPPERIQPKEVVKEEIKEPIRNVKVPDKGCVEVGSKNSVPKNVQPPADKPTIPPSLLPDLSFLRPPRRTSSQYVASAIAKHPPKTLAKPSYIPNSPECSASLKTPTTDLQKSGRSMQVNPRQSSLASLLDNKENGSNSTVRYPGPQRSTSYPEYMSDQQKDFREANRGGFENGVVATKRSSDMLETKPAKNHTELSGSTKIKVTAKEQDNVKHIQIGGPSPAKSNALNTDIKPPTAPKTISQGQTNNSEETPSKSQPPETVSDSSVTPGSPAVTVFGPVKKFRPVIHKSVEKETSLHSSLMEAIQTGGGKDRLKKISTSAPSSLKKGPYVEEENERCALLAAIRAQNNTGRLKKVKSAAAHELEKFRKLASEEERSPSSPSSPENLTCTSALFTHPPPPPAPTIAPPPPAPVLPQGKTSSVPHSNANAPGNPALAREAMLEAIRSGSAAERLKKVAVPKKTVQVNGKLGTIQASSSTIPEQ
ncbi:protein cordon-bleu isoform X3 [Oreochromis niloticus]|uniref:protein cordon-bleu isoform X3 n=1 Tax=Oreochromis niloticus TaxID=8128 RepID=UPI0009054816|nr:protein cordon-bleu isoform X3 [Oreochromis niloticus]